LWELVPINYKAAKIIIFLNATSSHADYLPLKIPSFSGAGNLLSLLASRRGFSPGLGELKHAVQSGLEIYAPSTSRSQIQISK